MSNEEIHGFDPNEHVPRFNKSSTTDKNAGVQKQRSKKKYYKSSSRPGSYIVDAVTGQTWNYKVGSEDEKRFFTVMINEGKEGVKLFYSSPEQYETHRRISLNDSIKIKWKQQEYERNVSEFEPNQQSSDNDAGDSENNVTLVK